MLAMIAAVAKNRVIGVENQLPWRLPNDLQNFKRITMGKPLIMGRKTFESIGSKPLPGRTNIVLTRDPSTHQAEGVQYVRSAQAAVSLAEQVCLETEVDETMIIGGGQIYEFFMPFAQRLYITQVHEDVDGDALFPEFSEDDWKLMERRDFSASEDSPHAYSFLVFDRRI